MVPSAPTALSCCLHTFLASSATLLTPSRLQLPITITTTSPYALRGRRRRRRRPSICLARCSNGSDSVAVEQTEEEEEEEESAAPSGSARPNSSSPVDKDINRVVQKTAATFAPRASTARKNPAMPGTLLYQVFEIQGYVCMLLGGALSYNLIFPSNEPDIWRLMGMWSIWMFTIPSLRARDCSKHEKEALNYLFLVIPLLNVMIPFVLKSFAVVWSADTIVFFMMYAWKLGWLQKAD